MHGFEETGAKLPDDPNDTRPWYRLLTRYHWFVLVVAALGWLFDTMDQQLFNIARRPAMRKLLQPEPGVEPAKETVTLYSGYATSTARPGGRVGQTGRAGARATSVARDA
jgi:hypothetical protein